MKTKLSADVESLRQLRHDDVASLLFRENSCIGDLRNPGFVHESGLQKEHSWSHNRASS